MWVDTYKFLQTVEEAVIHAMKSIFDLESTKAVILVNAFLPKGG